MTTAVSTDDSATLVSVSGKLSWASVKSSTGNFGGAITAMAILEGSGDKAGYSELSGEVAALSSVAEGDRRGDWFRESREVAAISEAESSTAIGKWGVAPSIKKLVGENDWVAWAGVAPITRPLANRRSR